MWNNLKRSGSVSGILLPMGLVCLFTFCSLTLALLGGQTYRQIQAGVDDAFNSSVAANYLRNKLTQNNAEGKISLRQEGVFDVVVITGENGGGSAVETRIYVIDGELRETYVLAEVPFEAASGITIALLGGCTFALSSDGIFTADIVSPEGVHTRVALALVAGKGDAL